jgi:beta-mannosidase
MINTLDLNGTWKVRWTDGVRGRPEYANQEEVDPDRYIDAQVPGDVHLDVWKAGWIPDPYQGTNCLAARWVEECIWSYRRHFDVPAEALKGRAWLVLDGLDLAATIVLNGSEIGKHANYFHPCRIEVTGKLQEGRNRLAVHVEAGLFEASDRRAEGYVTTLDQRLHKRHWLRKPQFQFGWDWSTRFINVGIHRGVRLEWTSDPVRIDQFVPLAELSPDLKKGTVRARLFVEGLGTETRKGVLTVDLPEAGAKASAEVDIPPGLNPCEVRLAVPDPKLWWPVGHGPQNLYAVRVSLSVDGGAVGEKTARIGFRHVRVNQDPHPTSGRYFHLEVNGRKVFAKGANFVPADMILARIDRARYEKLIGLALEAHFNFFRVWGGGLYESDDFYELCNERGIMVWQDFIFACARYPTTDEPFYKSIQAEAVHNIRRLARHPSLVVWCGNNEMEQGNWDWGYDQGVVLPDHAFFHLTLPRILAAEDPTRYYQPSSPFSPDRLSPNQDDVGDQHPWKIGFQNADFRDYRQMICRFADEGGFLAPVSLPTMKACLPEGQQKVGSFAWQVHDNSVDSWGEPSYTHRIMTTWLGRDIRSFPLDDLVYWGGLLQGEALREYSDNFRRRMFDSGAAVFWMYNDCWPATRSWTIVDYYLRRTPSFAPVKRAMAPVHVVVAQEGDEVVVFGINDTAEFLPCELHYGVFNLAGGCPVDRRAAVTLPPDASTPLARFKSAEWTHADSSAAFAVLSKGGGVLARNRLFLPFFKDLKWAPADIHVRLENGRAVFESTTFAWGVCIDLDGEESLPDNFFDLYPGMPYSIPWTKAEPPRVVKVGNLIA